MCGAPFQDPARFGASTWRGELHRLAGPLAGRKLIELEGVSCAFYGRLLRALGAEVWKVEPLSGDWARRMPPFVAGTTDLEHSLFWISYNAGKKSLTLNLESQDGKALFLELLSRADFLVSGYASSFWVDKGLELAELHQKLPSLVMASVTPFGLEVDLGDRPGVDIIVQASSGYMHMSGHPDRAPLMLGGGYQAPFHGAMWALVGSLIADYSRSRGGGGAFIDTSMQTSLVWLTSPVFSQWDATGVNLVRLGERRIVGTSSIKSVFRCRDGFIVWFLAGGPAGRVGMRELLEWMNEEGLAPQELAAVDWGTFDIIATAQDTLRTYEEQFESFFLTKTRDELLGFALRTGLMMAPVRDFDELLCDAQLASRNYWNEVSDARRGLDLRVPRAPTRTTDPIWDEESAVAPHLGEHTSEVLTKELGMSEREVIALRGQSVV
ncbi:MAG: hypothetical protein GEU28_02345 [Dehalococcoidia bacterium]|nr:hypothetical protein [Dehalococcoidia bacterium]